MSTDEMISSVLLTKEGLAEMLNPIVYKDNNHYEVGILEGYPVDGYLEEAVAKINTFFNKEQQVEIEPASVVPTSGGAPDLQ